MHRLAVYTVKAFEEDPGCGRHIYFLLNTGPIVLMFFFCFSLSFYLSRIYIYALRAVTIFSILSRNLWKTRVSSQVSVLRTSNRLPDFLFFPPVPPICPFFCSRGETERILSELLSRWSSKTTLFAVCSSSRLEESFFLSSRLIGGVLLRELVSAV